MLHVARGHTHPWLIQEGECSNISDRKQSLTFKLELLGWYYILAVFFHQKMEVRRRHTCFSRGEYEMPVCQLLSGLCCATWYEQQTLSAEFVVTFPAADDSLQLSAA